jgi:hypothetical protein
VAKPASHHSDDVQVYDRKQLSNREGFRRLEASLEKIHNRKSGQEKLCDVCGRRTRAWRMVPAKFGTKPAMNRARLNDRTALTGRVVLACDAGPDGCAAMLDRAGVSRDAIELEERLKKLGLVLP